LSISWYFVTAPYAVLGISPVKLFFDNGLTRVGLSRFGLDMRGDPGPSYDPLSGGGTPNASPQPEGQPRLDMQE